MHVIARFRRSGNLTILLNSGSLVATTGVSAALGFCYWWLAARHFSAAEVGFAAAAISAMTLIGTVCMLGLGTMLIGELPRRVGQRASLIVASLVVAGAAATALGALFALLSPYLAADLQRLAAGPEALAIFAAGAGLTAVALVLDQALIGLLRGDLQLARNTIFGAVKLGALWLIAAGAGAAAGLEIYLTWLLGNLVALAAMGSYILLRHRRAAMFRPDWEVLRGLGWKSLQHHLLDMVVLAPSLVLPLIVTATLSVTANAYFYTAWMLASFVSVGPTSLATVLYAVSSGDDRALARRLRFTLGLGLLIGLAANLVLFLGGHLLLSLFGREYADASLWTLRLLGLGVFPLIVREHYVAIARIRGRTAGATKLVAAISICRVAGAVIGAAQGGIVGLCLGLLAVESVAALTMLPTIYRAARMDPSARQVGAEQMNPKAP